jgi:hypothetical protein
METALSLDGVGTCLSSLSKEIARDEEYLSFRESAMLIFAAL